MGILKKIILTGIVLTLSITAMAQKYRYLNLGIGMASPVVKDDAMSPVKYYGLGIATHTGLRIYKEKTIFSLQGTFNLGIMSTSLLNIDNGMATFTHIGIKAIKLYRFRQIYNDDLFLYLGGGFSSMTLANINTNLNNSSFIYSSFNGLRLAAALRVNFEASGHDFIVSYQAEAEPFTYAFRPNYNRVFDFIDPETEGWKEILKNSKPAFLNRYFAYTWRASVLYKIRNNNALELYYSWDYFSYNDSYRIQSATHSLVLSLMFNF